MKHLDLFSGIGGFALAARWMGWQTVAFCEKEDYAQRVLKKHWPEVPLIKDIHELTEPVGCDIVTGGLPCQPFSVAGKQKGKTDDRYLWAQMARVIAQEKPYWVIGENVPGFIGLALDEVLFDLESKDYTCCTFILPACAVDACHRRDRVWIVAHANSKRGRCWDSAGENAENAGQPPRSEGNHSRGVEPWPTEPRVCRVVDGLPKRVDRIRGLGNAIVPQVAYQIFKHIDEFQRKG